MFGFAQQRRQMLEAELQRFAIEMPPLGVERAWLTGSMAQGAVSPETELELVVIQQTDEPFRRRSDFFLTHLRPRVGCTFTVYTPGEYDELSSTDSVLQRVEKFGDIVVG